jgi:ribosomal protein L2
MDGAILYSWAGGIPMPAEGQEAIPKSRMIQPGNCLLLRDIPVGTTIHNIGLKPFGRAQMCRSAGTCGQILFTADKGYAQVRLNSKEVRLISVDCVATIGTVGNIEHHNAVLGKAGVNRRLGRRPIVRGIAQSPFSHPHGGGRKSKGNKHPRSPWVCEM